MTTKLITGSETMGASIEQAPMYHNYVYSKFSSRLGKRVFEIGSGYGQYCEKMLEDGKNVLASDIDDSFVKNLKLKSKSLGNSFDVIHFNLETPEIYKEQIETFAPDTIVCMHILEHISDDKDSLQKLYNIVPEGCKLLIVVPAMEILYNILDREAGHYRRYNIREMSSLIKSTDWTLQTIGYFNVLGIVGWIFAGFLNRNNKGYSLDSNETTKLVQFFNAFLVPITSVFDCICKKLFGLSLLICLTKNTY